MAELAGVSPAIVSLVINDRVDGKVRISPETRQRVWEAIHQLGYVPDPAARRLAGGQNRLLGVFTYESVFPLQQQSYYYPFLVGIEEEAEAQDYNLLLFTRADADTGQRSVYRHGINGLRVADGVIMLGTHERREELTNLLQEEFPFVFVGRREVSGGEISYVAADYASATVRMVEYVVAHGHRRIAYLGMENPQEAQIDRETGFRLAYDRLGLALREEDVRRLDSNELTIDALRGYLQDGITAFVVENEAFAKRLPLLAREAGMEIPRDFSVAALEDSEYGHGTESELTTFLVPRREMGIHAVRLLVDALGRREAREPGRVTLPCTFVPGRTVGAPP